MKRWTRVLAQMAVLSGLAFVGAVLVLQWHPQRPVLRQVSGTAVPIRPYITLEEVLTKNDVVWIDARDASAHARGHIPGAILLNPQDWDALVGSHYGVLQDHTKHLVIYGDAASAAWVSQKLEESYGRPHLPILRGGWDAWRRQGAGSEKSVEGAD